MNTVVVGLFLSVNGTSSTQSIELRDMFYQLAVLIQG
jgi:hypothetical protein